MDDMPHPSLDLYKRRAQAFHALAAMERGMKRTAGPLFGRKTPSSDACVRRSEGALHVSGKVPVDCLEVGCVMD